jgi:hypothetical protein
MIRHHGSKARHQGRLPLASDIGLRLSFLPQVSFSAASKAPAPIRLDLFDKNQSAA